MVDCWVTEMVAPAPRLPERSVMRLPAVTFSVRPVTEKVTVVVVVPEPAGREATGEAEGDSEVGEVDGEVDGGSAQQSLPRLASLP